MDISKVRDRQKEGAIVYRYSSPIVPSSILYINLIARYACTNNCRFCSRPRGEAERGKPNLYEAGAGTSLYLPESPSIEEVMSAIASNIKSEDKEIAFVGPGEPLIYLPTVVGILKGIKSKYSVRTRADTNGSVRLTYPDAAHQLAEAGLDEIRISVNAINEEDYNALCRPKHKDAYKSMLSFLRECLAEGIDTKASFVFGFRADGLGSRASREYIRFSESLGIGRNNVVLRRYYPPI